VLNAFLAVGAVAVHDGENHVSLEVLGREDERGIHEHYTIEWLTPHLDHRVPSLECVVSTLLDEGVRGEGDIRNSAAHRVCVCVGGSGERKGEGMGGRGDKTGLLIYSCCEIADRIYRRQRKWAIDDGKRKRWMEGTSLPVSLSTSSGNFFLFFLFFVLRGWT